MQNITIERQGIRNLDFTGEIIGQSGGAAPRIKIYRTAGREYVGQYNASVKFSEAQAFATPELVINYFRNTVGLTAEVEDAIEDAAGHDEAFKAAWNEHVD